jgi:hypothetical protein
MTSRLGRALITASFVLCFAGGELCGADEPGKDYGLLSRPDYFPIAVWLQSPNNATKYRDIVVNLYVGLWKGPTAPQLATLHTVGMRLICDQNSAALARRSSGDIVGWLQPDEPDNAQPAKSGGYGPPVPAEKVMERYRKLKQADSSLPVLLNLGQGVAWDAWYGRGVRSNHPEDYRDYLKAGDIVSFDIYPVTHDSPQVKGNLWYVGRGVQRLVEWTDGKKPVWCCIEAAGNENVTPTAKQLRSEVWIAITHGATGIVYFCHEFKPKFVEAGLLTHPELVEGVKKVNAEVTGLATVIHSPTVKNVVIAHASDAKVPVQTMCKRVGDVVYVFAVTMRDVPVEVSFEAGAQGDAAAVEVVGESRNVQMKGGKFRDQFEGYGVHIYKLTDAR